MVTRKISGGKIKKTRKTKLHEKPGIKRTVILGERKKKLLRIRGGNFKPVLLKCNIANITDLKTKKTQKAEIKNVLEVPSNRFLARKNVLVKGAIIETSLGKARITNRPSQEACINAVLI